MSRELMRGNRWRLFCLYCRFLGWFLLSLLTLGIGFLWYTPYQRISVVQFYAALKEKGNSISLF